MGLPRQRRQRQSTRQSKCRPQDHILLLPVLSCLACSAAGLEPCAVMTIALVHSRSASSAGRVVCACTLAAPQCLTSSCCLCRNSDLNDMPMKLDLHGLHVHEAVAQLMKTIDEWRDSPECMRTGEPRHSLMRHPCPCMLGWSEGASEQWPAPGMSHVSCRGHLPDAAIPAGMKAHARCEEARPQP